MKSFIAVVGAYLKPWFHKRNIIIVSEHKVKHLPLSGHAQFFGLAAVVSCVCWASYSTGSFMAARSVMKEQSQTIRSVTSARVESNLNPLAQVAPLPAPEGHALQDTAMAVSINEPMYTVSALSQNRVLARIVQLEQKIADLKNANEAIIQRVHDKASGDIDNLESVIKQTGLNPENLKKQYSYNKPKTRRAEGGPYIPDDMSAVSPSEYALYGELDRLAALHQIVGTLPLASPVEDADRQSAFGHRIDPFTGRLAFHSGLDLAGPAGAKIYAPVDGKVISAGPNGAYGNCVDISHGFGVTTRYGHLSKILVRDGQQVRKGDVIGIQGTSGRSTGPHLHYEVRYHDKPMNPANFLEAGRYVSQN